HCNIAGFVPYRFTTSSEYQLISYVYFHSEYLTVKIFFVPLLICVRECTSFGIECELLRLPILLRRQKQCIGIFQLDKVITPIGCEIRRRVHSNVSRRLYICLRNYSSRMHW